MSGYALYIMTEAPTPMIVTPGGHTRGNTQFPSKVQDLVLKFKKGIGTNPGEEFKKIQVHLVYACKHDGFHKARFCANGNLTEILINSIYSGVVSLKNLRTVIFLTELNGLETWATHIGNAYLETETSGKVFIIAGPKSGELAGHTLVIFKLLYGLQSSGLRWSDKFSFCLQDMRFFASLADPRIWMR
jgi:hypothetical protein